MVDLSAAWAVGNEDVDAAVGAVSALSDEALQEAIASFYATLERTAFIEAAGRSDLLATARVLWPRVAFSMEEDDILAIGEEEQTILNPAREDASEELRQQLGADWAARRNELLEDGAGSLEQV